MNDQHSELYLLYRENTFIKQYFPQVNENRSNPYTHSALYRAAIISSLKMSYVCSCDNEKMRKIISGESDLKREQKFL